MRGSRAGPGAVCDSAGLAGAGAPALPGAAPVHAREVVKQALARNAAAVILAHNHPSGLAEPSVADQMVTQRLKEALALIEVRTLDHLVIGDGVCQSFAERGLL